MEIKDMSMTAFNKTGRKVETRIAALRKGDYKLRECLLVIGLTGCHLQICSIKVLSKESIIGQL